MKYNILLPVFMLFISLTGFSQAKQYVYYFDKDFNPVEKTKSIFNGIGIYENGRLELRMYNTLDKNLVSIEHYTDSSLQVSDGLFQSYYRNASLELEGNYLKGKEDGLWKRWDTLGHTIDSTVYDNGEKIIEVQMDYFKNGTLNSFIVNDVKNDRFKKTYYNNKGRLTSEANFTGQKGIVKYYDSTMNVRIDTVFSRLEIEASFPGGDGAWSQYIAQQLEKNMNALIKDGKSGTCRLRFIVDKEGNIKDVSALTMQGTRLAKLAINAITKGPKWIPASQYGRPVKAYREQPIRFTVE